MELDFFANTLLVDGALPIFTIFLRLPVQKDTLIKTLNNGNRTEWSPIRVSLHTELDDRKFCYQFIAYYNYNKICDILGFLKSKHKKFQEPFLLAVKKKKTHLSAWKGITATSGAQFTTQPLVKPFVWFACPVVNWRSRSVTKSVKLLRHDTYCPISAEMRTVDSLSHLRILL